MFMGFIILLPAIKFKFLWAALCLVRNQEVAHALHLVQKYIH